MWKYKVTLCPVDTEDTEEEVVFYNPNDEQKTLENAVVSLGIGDVGSFQFTATKNHPLIDELIPYQVNVRVYDNTIKEYDAFNKPIYTRIFSGRLVSVRKNFNGSITCEADGYGAYLEDAILPVYIHEINNMEDLLQGIINLHNNVITDDNIYVNDGLLTLGNVEYYNFGGMTYFPVEYQTTKEVLDAVIERFGGNYYVNAYGELNYFNDGNDLEESNQVIRLGQNLLDYVHEIDRTEIYSRVYPVGAKFNEFDGRYESENDNETSFYQRVQLNSVGTGRQDAYVENSALKDLIGVKGYLLVNDDIKGYDAELDPESGDPEGLTICGDKLYQLATDFLNKMQFMTINMSIKAIDMNIVDETKDPLRMLQNVRVKSLSMGLDVTLPITSVSINILSPSENSYDLGLSNKRTLTGRLRR